MCACTPLKMSHIFYVCHRKPLFTQDITFLCIHHKEFTLVQEGFSMLFEMLCLLNLMVVFILFFVPVSLKIGFTNINTLLNYVDLLFCRKDREGVLLQNPTVLLFLKILIAHTKYSKSLFFAVSCMVSSFYSQFSPIYSFADHPCFLFFCKST